MARLELDSSHAVKLKTVRVSKETGGSQARRGRGRWLETAKPLGSVQVQARLLQCCSAAVTEEAVNEELGGHWTLERRWGADATSSAASTSTHASSFVPSCRNSRRSFDFCYYSRSFSQSEQNKEDSKMNLRACWLPTLTLFLLFCVAPLLLTQDHARLTRPSLLRHSLSHRSDSQTLPLFTPAYRSQACRSDGRERP